MVVRDMLAQLKDVHASMSNPSGASVPTWQPDRFVNWQQAAWQKRLAATDVASQVSGGWGHGLIDGVPYLYFSSWQSSLDISAVDFALDSYVSKGAIVIDVRMNGGGNDTPAFAVAGRFQRQDHTIGTVQYRAGPAHSDFGTPITRVVKPRGQLISVKVIVLAGRGTFSSAEGFLLAMKGVPNITIAGDTSGGGSGNPQSYELVDGWRYNVPRWIERSASGDVIEWRGIAPDVVIAANAQSFAGGDDPVLNAAIQLARSSQRSQR